MFESTNTSGVSGVNVLAAESNIIEVTGNLYFRCNKTTEKTLCFRPKSQLEVAELVNVAWCSCMEACHDFAVVLLRLNYKLPVT